MIYTWRCDKCKKETDVSRSLADIDKGPDESCCGTYERIIPQLATRGIKGFVLEGTGWGYDGYVSRFKGKEEK